MAKAAKKLTDRQVRTLSEGRHSDGDGLFLVVGKSARRWVFRYRPKGTWGEGFGPLKEVPIGRFGEEADGNYSLAGARLQASEFRKMVADGRTPGEVETPRAVPTFGQMADELIEKRKDDYRSPKSLSRIKAALEVHAKPLRVKPVDKITEDDVLDVLKPLWKSAPIMAEKVRGYIWTVMENANDHYTGRNPAMWKGRLERRLAKRKRLKKGHHPAMPHADVPAFMTKLRVRTGTAARALEFLILCGVRSAEVRLARWGEFDLERKVWSIPEGRTKAGREHRVPLSNDAVSILTSLGAEGADPDALAFPGAKTGAPLSVMTFSKTLSLMDIESTEAVPHGFRSSFRDWAEDVAGYSFELAEQALSHVVGDGTVRAYRRSDALEKRRELARDWADHCAGRPRPPANAAQHEAAA